MEMMPATCICCGRVVPLLAKANKPVTRMGLGFFLLWAVTLMAAPDLRQADALEVRWDEKVEVASGHGVRGPWRMNASEFHYVDDPTVAINEEGAIGLAWVDQARRDILFQRYEPDGKQRFKEPVNVSKSPHTFSWLPRLVMADGETSAVYLLWQEIVFSGGSHGGEMFFARSSDGGRTFSPPINLSNTIAGAGKGRLTRHHWDNGSLDLVMGPGGTLYAAWTEYEGALWFSRSTDGGASFSEPQRIAGGGEAAPARGPSLAVDAKETIYLAWTVGEQQAANIHFTQSDDRGRSFETPQIVFESSGHSEAPEVAVDGEGTVHLVYAESPAGPLQRYAIHYTQLPAGERRFKAPRDISGPHTEAFESVNFPTLRADDAGNLYVLWEIFPRQRGRPRGLGFTSSNDGGRTFGPPSVVPSSDDPTRGFNGSQQGLLMRKLAVNGAGAIAVVNSTFNMNETSHVWLFRGRTR